jgi:hypothetical protein
MPPAEDLLARAAILLAFVAVALAARRLARAYLDFRAKRLVSCPETGRTVAVSLDASHAALTSVTGHARLRLSDCTRWPERRDCGQECLRQIEAAPEGCKVRSLLDGWYRGKRCVYCRRPFAEIRWSDHKPALLDPTRRVSLAWRDVAPQDLPELLATHLPVCWDCHIVESFAREHPDLIVDRHRSAERPHPPAS